MKKQNRKLTLDTETVRQLNEHQLVGVGGGFELRDQKYTPKCPPYTDFTCTCIG